MHRLIKPTLAAVVAVLAVLLTAGSCGPPEAQQRESNRQQASYNRLTAGQPAKAMGYSPTRSTINYWIDTWEQPNKLSYVYLQASNGQLVGYYVFRGLPVSYCASLTPTFRWERPIDGGEAQTVPAPAMDGVYYSNAGGLCSTYYGRDATTNSYMEYTVGTGISALIYEEPLPRQDVEPLGFTEIKDVE
jgi:hypothetical protein